MPVQYLPKKQETILHRHGVEYIASDNNAFNQAFERALSLALKNALPREGEFEFSFEVDAGVFAGDPLKNHSAPSLYWYYLVDRIKGDIAPLRYRGANLQDKIYGYTRHTSSCRVVDCSQLAESHSLSMLPDYLHLSPSCNLNYFEYILIMRERNE